LEEGFEGGGAGWVAGQHGGQGLAGGKLVEGLV
jgi:hypothetical protein